MTGRRFARGVAGLAVAGAAVLFVVPAPEGVPPAVMPAAALAVFTVVFWATGVVAGHLTALACEQCRRELQSMSTEAATAFWFTRSGIDAKLIPDAPNRHQKTTV